MTEKQKNLLHKYLDEKSITKLESMDFSVTSSVIDMILKCKRYALGSIETNMVPRFKTREVDPDISKFICDSINQDPMAFYLCTQSSISVVGKEFLDDAHCWYLVKCKFFKGESNSPIIVDTKVKIEDGECVPYKSIYNELIDMGIYSLTDMTCFFFRKAEMASTQAVDRARTIHDTDNKFLESQGNDEVELD